MKRGLGDGYELDDDPARIDRDAVHRFLSEESYWAKGRSREVQDGLIEALAARRRPLPRRSPDRLLEDGVGRARRTSYLADVYVLEEHRGRGLGVELVRFSVDEGPFARTRWLLHTEDAHDLYRKFGFSEPSLRMLERPPPES